MAKFIVGMKASLAVFAKNGCVLFCMCMFFVEKCT